jgi:hypothetical protein
VKLGTTIILNMHEPLISTILEPNIVTLGIVKKWPIPAGSWKERKKEN